MTYGFSNSSYYCTAIPSTSLISHNTLICDPWLDPYVFYDSLEVTNMYHLLVSNTVYTWGFYLVHTNNVSQIGILCRYKIVILYSMQCAWLIALFLRLCMTWFFIKFRIITEAIQIHIHNLYSFHSHWNVPHLSLSAHQHCQTEGQWATNRSWLVHEWSIMNEGINIVEAQFCDGDIVPRDSLEVYIVLEFSD